MMTFFTAPKPFRETAGIHQRNALASWRGLDPAGETLVFGAEAGAAEAAGELGLRHVAAVARNDFGTPLLPDLFTQAERFSRHPLLCYINCDIVLFADFVTAVRRVSALRDRFLLVGQCRDLAVPGPTRADDVLRARALREGRLRGTNAVDYFVFTRGLYPVVPPLAIGRAGVDNWLVWQAVESGAVVVDATATVCAVHQAHGYGHVPGGREESYRGVEAQRNLTHIGPTDLRFGTADATHNLTPAGLRWNWRRVARQFKRWRRRATAVGR
jgi:hypothetical protein